MKHEPWINHDKYHRIGTLVPQKKAEAVKKNPILRPYPTRERLLELFYLEDGLLKYRKVHGNAKKDGVAGYINPNNKRRYIRIDYQQCNSDRLIKIYLGEEI